MSSLVQSEYRSSILTCSSPRQTREPNYEDTGITENTRCAYPIEYIKNAKIPCMSSSQPKNVIYVSGAYKRLRSRTNLTLPFTVVITAHLRRLRCVASRVLVDLRPGPVLVPQWLHQ